jgi:hypothetical protein
VTFPPLCSWPMLWATESWRCSRNSSTRRSKIFSTALLTALCTRLDRWTPSLDRFVLSGYSIETTTFRNDVGISDVKVLFQQIMFHMVIEGPERLHGQILGIPGLPGSIPVPIMQGKKSPIYKGIFPVLTACLDGRNKFYNVEQVCPVPLPSEGYSYRPRYSA